MPSALGSCGTASGLFGPASPSVAPRCSTSDRRRSCGRVRVSSRPTSRGEGRKPRVHGGRGVKRNPNGGGNEERMAPRKARPTVYPVKSSGSNSHKGLQHVEHVGQGSQCLIDFADVLIFQRHDYPSPCSTLLFRLGHQAVVDVVQLFALQQRQENAI